MKVLHVCEKGEEIIHELETPLEEGTLAEGKAYYKDYDIQMPETLSAYGFGDLPLTL